MGEVIDRAGTEREPDHEVQDDQGPDLSGQAATLAIQYRVVDPAGREQAAEQAEDRPRRSNRADERIAEHIARDRRSEITGKVHDDEQLPAVDPLHDRPDEVEGIHVECEVDRALVQERNRQEAPVLPAGNGALVEQEAVVDRAIRRGDHVGHHRDRDDRVCDRKRQAVAPASGEIAPRRSAVAGFLGQPAQPRCNLGLVARWGPSVGFPIRLDGGGQAASAHELGRDAPPGQIAARCLADVGRRPPAREGLVLLVRPEPDVADAQKSRCRNRRLGIANDAGVEVRGVLQVP